MASSKRTPAIGNSSLCLPISKHGVRPGPLKRGRNGPNDDVVASSAARQGACDIFDAQAKDNELNSGFPLLDTQFIEDIPQAQGGNAGHAVEVGRAFASEAAVQHYTSAMRFHPEPCDANRPAVYRQAHAVRALQPSAMPPFSSPDKKIKFEPMEMAPSAAFLQMPSR
jgi:hypothetical protein